MERERGALPAIGFIGCGMMAEALIRGFCDRAGDMPYPIVVSPRSERRSGELARLYPGRVSVAGSMQEVLDRSDWIVLSVLPGAAKEVVESLTFRGDHAVMNVMFDKTREEIVSWMNVEPRAFVHLVLGTYLSFYPGPIGMCPDNAEAAEILGRLGEVIPIESRYRAAVFAAITGLFASFFSIEDHVISWAESQGVPGEAAKDFVTRMFAALSAEAMNEDREGVHRLATVQTPGGINLQALELIREAGGFQAWVDAMGPIFQRAAGDIPRD